MISQWHDFKRVWRESGLPWATTLASEHLGISFLQRRWRPCRVGAESLRQQIYDLLTAWGMNEAHAELCARRILYADLRGIDSHGAAMMHSYRERAESGRLNMNPQVRVVEEGAATALVNGDGGLGHIAGAFAMKIAIDKARQSGLAAVGVRNSWHFGAAGAYAADASREGLIGMAMTNTPTPSVVPTAASEPRLGTNPIAFFAPSRAQEREEPAFALDMATSTVSRGKLLHRWRQGHGIPDSWAVKPSGRPDRNGRRAFNERRLTPLGGSSEGGSYKGYGLGLMVEVLCGVLTGADSGNDSGIGHFFLVIDPQHFREDGNFDGSLHGLLSDVRSGVPIDAETPIRVAGDPEKEALDDRMHNGVTLDRHVFEDLRHLAIASNIPFLLQA